MAATQTPILITGGTGFAGTHLVERLLEVHSPEEIHVTAYSTKQNRVSELLPAANIHALDLREYQQTSSLFSKLKPQQLYHLASLSTVGNSFEDAAKIFHANFAIQHSVLESLKQVASDCRALMVGSAQEYDFKQVVASGKEIVSEEDQLGPANPYGVSKVSQDLLALSYYYSYQLPILRVRPFNHIGEYQTKGFVVADFASQIVEIERGTQQEIEVGNLAAVRDFTDVKDMVEAYITVMDQGELGQVYNIGSGIGVSVQSILDSLIALSSADIKVTVDQSRIRPLDVPSIIVDNEKIRKLGWSPSIPLEKTLQRVLEYWRSQ